MNARRWATVVAIAAAGSAVVFLSADTSELMRPFRRRSAAVDSIKKPYQSQLLAEVFDRVPEREGPYQPMRKGQLEFNKHIAPIVYDKCARCHYVGGVAPFPLTSFDDVRKRARRIAHAVSGRLMPPWRADRCSPEFVGDFSLSKREKGMLKQWLAEGYREGDRANAPSRPTPPPEWPNGAPDAILQPAEAFQVPAEGPDFFRWFVIPTDYGEDRYVRLSDVSPGSKAVHHVLVYSDASGGARKLDQADYQPGFSGRAFPAFTPASQFGQWEPGVFAPPLPDGIAFFLPKHSDIVIQVHYHPSGKEETDLTRVALYFSKKPVDKRLRCMPVFVAPKVLRILAGESTAIFWAEQEVPGDISVVQIFPHMHLLGREIAAAATLPDGSSTPLIRISNWDFRWQSLYMLKTPLRLPAGSRIRFEARFDNSAANPRNPNQPPKSVRFGLTTADEMCILNVLYTVDSERLTEGELADRRYPDTFFPTQRRSLVSGQKEMTKVPDGR